MDSNHVYPATCPKYFLCLDTSDIMPGRNLLQVRDGFFTTRLAHFASGFEAATLILQGDLLNAGDAFQTFFNIEPGDTFEKSDRVWMTGEFQDLYRFCPFHDPS